MTWLSKKQLQDNQIYVFVLFLALSIYIFGLNTGPYIDDAYIYLETVKNIVNGYGPVFNVGDGHIAVTSPFWTYALAFFVKIFSSVDLLVVTKALYIFFLAVTSYFTYTLLKPFAGFYAVFVPLLIFTNPLSNSFVGGETAYVYFALTGIFWALLVKKNSLLTGIFLGLAYLSRGELIFIMPLVLGYYAVMGMLEKKSVRDVAYEIWPLLGSFFIIVIIWHAYYYSQFHALFPSTFEAKIIQGQSGWPLYSSMIKYQLFNLVHFNTYLLFFTIVGALTFGLFPLFVIAFTIMHSIAYSYLKIPDYGWYFYDYHFIIPLMTVYGTVGFFNYANKTIVRYIHSGKTRKILENIFIVSLIPIFAAMLFFVTNIHKKHISTEYQSLLKDNHIYFDNGERFRNYKIVGEWLSKHTDKSDTVLTPEIGIIAYYLENGFVRDINGLASPGITMETMNNYEYFVEKYLPRYIIYPWNQQPNYRYYFDRQKDIFYFYKKVYVVDENAKEYNTSVFELIPEKDVNKYIDEISQERKGINKLPKESDDILLALDWGMKNGIYTVLINGWAYIKGHGSENSKISIVFMSKENTYIFNSNRHKRPDVTSHFKTLNFDDSGFSGAVFKRNLKPGEYRVGIYIEKDNMHKLQFTNNVIRIADTNGIEFSKEANNIELNFDAFKDDIHSVSMNGWAYIKGHSSENSKIFVVFKSNTKTYIFDAGGYKRPDVTAFFKTQNYDDSGFDYTAHKDELTPGSYKVGILIEKDKIKEIKFTDKTVEVK